MPLGASCARVGSCGYTNGISSYQWQLLAILWHAGVALVGSYALALYALWILLRAVTGT
jgi:hypothetical protein